MKTVNFQGIDIKIDRPKGFVQKGKDENGKPWERVYKLDYGYIPKTHGGDDDEVDVFIGPNKNAHEAFWVTQKKKDGSFDEWKIFLGFNTKDEAKKAYTDHIPAKFMSGITTMSVSMMRTMLGIHPLRKVATVQLSFFDELSQIQNQVGTVQ